MENRDTLADVVFGCPFDAAVGYPAEIVAGYHVDLVTGYLSDAVAGYPIELRDRILSRTSCWNILRVIGIAGLYWRLSEGEGMILALILDSFCLIPGHILTFNVAESSVSGLLRL
ncbi:hypothetical protein LWI28_027505 [Acer negundo]|uniref:Uncharacterized protein n=1 Tax=Acer negundo TaxID=4023 RepID=A0AAD5IAW1_ACENE|nr:hypothetical protein LWI28_027505 [Acer negundo]